MGFLLLKCSNENITWNMCVKLCGLCFYYISESMLAAVQKKITDAFDIFDHEANKTVDVRYSMHMHTMDGR